MALPNHLGDREYEKFIEDAQGNVAVRQGPGAINDSGGNELALDAMGRARTYDRAAQAELENISNKLDEVIYHLSLISGG